MAVDQLVFAPLFLGVYFAYNHYLENNCNMSGLKARLDAGYVESLKANYKVWPAVQMVNFCLVPVNYQLVFLNIVAIGWTAFLSNLNAKAAYSKIHFN